MNSRLVWVSAALAALTAERAQAQFVFNYTDFGTQCTPGSLRACSSTEVWNEIDPATGTIILAIRLANVQGTPGFEDVTPTGLMDWSLNNLSLVTYGQSFTPHPGWDVLGHHAYGVLSGNAEWCLRYGFDASRTPFECTDEYTIGDPVRLRHDPGDLWRIDENIPSGSSGAALWGCDIPWGPEGTVDLEGEYSAAYTCGGHATWRFQPRQWLPGSADPRYFGFLFTPQSSVSYRYRTSYAPPTSIATCTTGVDCAMVTPEPVTTVLMATGLLGIAGVSVLRRRRRNSSEG